MILLLALFYNVHCHVTGENIMNKSVICCMKCFKDCTPLTCYFLDARLITIDELAFYQSSVGVL